MDRSLPQSKHLLLLVGGNPLPNAVAGKLLSGPEATITLVHSLETAGIAQRLRSWLARQGHERVRFKEVGESDSASVIRGVLEELKTINPGSIGLNYTGGTKAMSVHAYRVLEQWAEETGITPVFTYLDARTLEMVCDPTDAACGEQERRVYVGREVEVGLDDLLGLHGWSLKHEPTSAPSLPRTASALAEVSADNTAFQRWIYWVETELCAKCRRPNKDVWRSKAQLQSISLTLPGDMSLEKVVQSLRDELLVPIGPLQLEHDVFHRDPERFCKWLHGQWLEHRVLGILNSFAIPVGLHECAQNIEANEVQFDIDVIALRGYQLFAFSCSTDSKKPLLKSKLFEAFARARQVGGDEARVALVCCSEAPEALEQEMRNVGISEGHLRVFGRKHFAELPAHLKQWIQEQSKGR